MAVRSTQFFAISLIFRFFHFSSLQFSNLLHQQQIESLYEMRLITGDECGLIKEIIPEINRSTINSSRISPTELRVNEGVTRLCCAQSTSFDTNHIKKDTLTENSHDSSNQKLDLSMQRSQGVVGLAFCPSVQPKSIAFCALRLDGTVERWEGVTGTGANETIDHKTHNALAYYTKTHSWSHILGGKIEGDVGNMNVERPIGICSSQRYQNAPRGSGDCTIACCTSMGSVYVFRLNHNVNLEEISTYEPYGTVSPPTIAYTKGNFVNKDLATSMAMDYDGSRLAIGGREREILLLDIATGSIVWKVCLNKCYFRWHLPFVLFNIAAIFI